MNQPKSAFDFLDALADITSYDDRQVIETSLLRMLADYRPDSSFWLYEVLELKSGAVLGLLAQMQQGECWSTPYPVRKELPAFLDEAVERAIRQGSVVICEAEQDAESHVVYPAEKKHQRVFVLLIERTVQSHPVLDIPHSVFRIHSNFVRLLEQTRHDKLTGLLNRETLKSEISRIIILNSGRGRQDPDIEPDVATEKRAFKGRRQHWLGVVDIDHFKQINDTFGHLYGDEILILVARLMEKSVRDYDLIFRYGGEEFVILLKAADAADAWQAFERIRQSIGQHQYARVEKVSVSIGMTQIVAQPGPVEVINEADQALYYAKQHGRNQVHSYQLLLSEGLIEAEAPVFETGGVNFF